MNLPQTNFILKHNERCYNTIFPHLSLGSSPLVPITGEGPSYTELPLYGMIWMLVSRNQTHWTIYSMQPQKQSRLCAKLSVVRPYFGMWFLLSAETSHDLVLTGLWSPSLLHIFSASHRCIYNRNNYAQNISLYSTSASYSGGFWLTGCKRSDSYVTLKKKIEKSSALEQSSDLSQSSAWTL